MQERDLDRIGQRDANRELQRARELRRRQSRAKWAYKVPDAKDKRK